jgi:hypothetical protein
MLTPLKINFEVLLSVLFEHTFAPIYELGDAYNNCIFYLQLHSGVMCD